MLHRYANPLIVWTIFSAAAFAQQPGFRQTQPGTQQPTRQPNQQQPVGQQPAGQRPNSQFSNQPNAQQQQQPSVPQQQPGNRPVATQQLSQQPEMRSASTTNGIGNSPMDRQAMEQQLAAQQAALAEQLAKSPFPELTAPQLQYLDQVLNVWEQSTKKIERYQCNFKRWIYDPAQNTGDDAAAKGEGVIRFMQPDKGLFKVEKVEFFSGRDDKQAATYRENERQKFGEYWLCDGDYVHILDRNEKKCLKVQLPPYMRGQQIHLSPLPFLFGVKASDIKSRYWVRPIAPPQGNKDVWLETYPKRPDDAGNYSRVQIVLDANEVLPKALIVFLPNWRPGQQHREVYEFTDRDKDWNMLDQMKAKLFKEEFIPQALPKEWEIVVEPYQEPQADPVQGTPAQVTSAQVTSAQVSPAQVSPAQAGNPQQPVQPRGVQPQQQSAQPQQLRQAQTGNPNRPTQPSANR
ncbi:MAG: TIGR03009 domain-containing protein [Pirellulaceae bacterium]|nr:TIGR03009 domain-containing protein [Pirellulaceae bacterium]